MTDCRPPFSPPTYSTPSPPDPPPPYSPLYQPLMVQPQVALLPSRSDSPLPPPMLISTLHSLVELPPNLQEIPTSPDVQPASQAGPSGAATGPSTATVPAAGPTSGAATGPSTATAPAAGPATAAAATATEAHTFLTGAVSDQLPSLAMFQQIPPATIVTSVRNWNPLILRSAMPYSDGLGDLEVQRVTHKKLKFASYQHEYIEMVLWHKQQPDMQLPRVVVHRRGKLPGRDNFADDIITILSATEANAHDTHPKVFSLTWLSDRPPLLHVILFFTILSQLSPRYHARKSNCYYYTATAITALEIYRPDLPAPQPRQGQAQKKESRYLLIKVLDTEQVARDAAKLIAQFYAIHFRWVILPLVSSSVQSRSSGHRK